MGDSPRYSPNAHEANRCEVGVNLDHVSSHDRRRSQAKRAIEAKAAAIAVLPQRGRASLCVASKHFCWFCGSMMEATPDPADEYHPRSVDLHYTQK